MRRGSIIGWRVALVVAITAVVTSVGCGPITYIVAINDAAQAVEEARQQGAPETAAYDYWLAVEHLAKAREFAGEAEYQAAMDMAETAETAGQRARDMARQRQRPDGGR